MNRPPKHGWRRPFSPLPADVVELFLADPARIEKAREALRKRDYERMVSKRRKNGFGIHKRNGK